MLEERNGKKSGLMNSAVSLFEQKGALATALSDYEDRPSQRIMAGAVRQALEEEEVLLVEAGTGTGKSLAYLAPALFYAVQQKKKVLVSTHTIHLQEQLLHKDLPVLKKTLPFPFRAVLIKGRGNYVSLRRLEKANRHAQDLFGRAEEFLEYDRLLRWTLTTTDGSLQDLEPQPSLSLWEQVRSDADNCMGRKCPTYAQCFYYQARRQIEQADLLIVNHALFFSNLALRGSDYSILPNVDAIIFDEAHVLEEVATEHLGFAISASHIRYLLTRLYHPRKRKGILVAQKNVHSIVSLVEETLKANDLLFQLIAEKVLCYSKKENDALRVRQSYWVENLLHEPLGRLYHGLDEARNTAESQEEELEYSSWMRKISGLQSQLDDFFEQSLEDSVYWIETHTNHVEKTTLSVAPIEVGAILKERLFDQTARVILTSATLAVEGTFSYLRERLGIDSARELMLDSPFDFQNQMTLHIPQRMPHPEDTESYLPTLIHQIKNYLLKSQGRAFVLFTSYHLMDSVYSALLDWLEQQGMTALKQGAGVPRHKMLQVFRETPKAVLFGTDSFWSGVDIQGEALSNVIITKLPFAVPDHPIHSARYEKIRQQGKDPFWSYALPQAIMKFKQGFGRLIRTKNDTGIVVVLDSRILTKNYGKNFLDSLPTCKIRVENDDETVP